MDTRLYAKAISNLLGSDVGFTLKGTDYSTLVINGPIAKPTEEQISTEYLNVVAAENLEELRKERNKLLAETDYFALSDQTLSTDMQIYRQALRDITNTYSSLNDEGFAFPIKP